MEWIFIFHLFSNLIFEIIYEINKWLGPRNGEAKISCLEELMKLLIVQGLALSFLAAGTISSELSLLALSIFWETDTVPDLTF
jgi:hypothetical protein